MSFQQGNQVVRAVLTASIISLLLPLGPSQVFAGREVASNLLRPDDGVEVISTTRWLASQIRTDGSAYLLDSVKLRLLATQAGAVTAAVYSDAGGRPGALIATLNQSGNITAAPSNVLFRAPAGGGGNGTTTRTTNLSSEELSRLKLPGGISAGDLLGAGSRVSTSSQLPAGIVLDPNSTYWIVTRAVSGQYASSYTDVETGSGRLFSPVWSHSENRGSSWTSETLSPLKYAAFADPYEPVNLLELRVDQEAINSAMFSGLPMALAQRELAFVAGRETQRSVNVARRRYLGEPSGNLPWEIFTSIGYGSTDQDDRSPAAGFETDLFAETIGFQRQVLPGVKLGGAFTYVTSQNGLGLSTGEVELTGPALTAFSAFQFGRFGGSLLYSYGQFEHDINRDTLYGRNAKGSPTTHLHTLALDLSADFQVGSYVTGPLATVTYLTGNLGGYRENGGGTSRLEFDAQSFDSLVTQFGWQVTRAFTTHGLTITPQLRAAWWHEHRNEGESVTATLADSPFQLGSGDSFERVGGFSTTAQGRPPGTDALELGGSLTVDFSDQVSLTVDYQGRYLQGLALTHSVVLSGKVAF